MIKASEYNIVEQLHKMSIERRMFTYCSVCNTLIVILFVYNEETEGLINDHPDRIIIFRFQLHTRASKA